MAKYVYISGPVTGLDYDQAKEVFDRAAEQIRRKHDGNVVVVNPMDICGKGEDWGYCMRKCIVALCECSFIHMLPGFEDSKGARLELTIAKALGFGIVDANYDLQEYEEKD